MKLLEIKMNCICGVQVTPPLLHFAFLNKIISSFSIPDCVKVKFFFLFKHSGSQPVDSLLNWNVKPYMFSQLMSFLNL